MTKAYNFCLLFQILATNEYKPEYDDLLEKNLQVVVKLIKKFVKDVSICVSCCRILFTIVSCKWPDKVNKFLISGFESNHELLPFFNEFDEHHGPVLYLGVMAFVTDFQADIFDSQILEAVDLKSLKEIERLLLNVKNVDIAVCWADLWVTFLLKNKPKENELKGNRNSDILKSLFSVVIAYWNHSLVHRSRIDPIVSKILKFEYDRLQNPGSIEDLMIFQYMMDMSWKVPFKYFVCRHLLSFAVSQDLLNEVMHHIVPHLLQSDPNYKIILKKIVHEREKSYQC